MRKSMGLFISVFLMIINFYVWGDGDVIINPDISGKSSSQKTLIIKEVMNIGDLSDDFYFKHPKNIKISPDGYIFVLDNKQLLKFKPDGRFCNNFFKYGQGPGEIINITNYLIRGKELIIHDSGQNKVLIFDHESYKLIKEKKLPFYSYSELFYALGDTLIFAKSKINDTGGKLKIVDVDMSLISFNLTDGKLEEKINFPMKYLVLKAGDRFFNGKRAKFLSCPVNNHLIYISHTAEYNIVGYDLKTDSIKQRFTREYKRVRVTPDTKKYAPGGNFGKIGLGNGEMFEVPVDKFHLDIQKMLYYKSNLLVVTSTITDDNKVLVDVYDNNGKYVDFFYIKLPTFVIPFKISYWLECIDGDFLFTVETDDQEQKCIKKYEIEKWE